MSVFPRKTLCNKKNGHSMKSYLGASIKLPVATLVENEDKDCEILV